MSFDPEKYITNVPDFPSAGVIFKDVSPLLKHKLKETLELLSAGVNWSEIDYIVGIESRGFILASGLAILHGKGFIPIRKKGKLPPPVLAQKYTLEYGEDIIEMHSSNQPGNILLVDDVLATGGTLRAAMSLCEKASYTIKDICVLIDLKFLNNFEASGINVKSLLKYN